MVRDTDKAKEFSFHLMNKRLTSSSRALKAQGFSKKEIQVLLKNSF